MELLFDHLRRQDNEVNTAITLLDLDLTYKIYDMMHYISLQSNSQGQWWTICMSWMQAKRSALVKQMFQRFLFIYLK